MYFLYNTEKYADVQCARPGFLPKIKEGGLTAGGTP